MMNAIAVTLGTFITHIEIKKMIGYSFIERVADTYKSLLITIVMCSVVYAVKFALGFVLIPVIIKLIIEVMVGFVTYWLLSMVFKIDVYVELVNIIKKVSDG